MKILITCNCGERVYVEPDRDKEVGLIHDNTVESNIDVYTDYDPRLTIHCKKCGRIETL